MTGSGVKVISYILRSALKQNEEKIQRKYIYPAVKQPAPITRLSIYKKEDDGIIVMVIK